jgi:hypothetical protein
VSWDTFDNGQSLGQQGSENGVIIRDEEHVKGARITLERDGVTAPFSITCGIYGWMVHTCFFGAEPEAQIEFESMKVEIASILDIIPLTTDPNVNAKSQVVAQSVAKFVEKFR